jgi:hypothetical protein
MRGAGSLPPGDCTTSARSFCSTSAPRRVGRDPGGGEVEGAGDAAAGASCRATARASAKPFAPRLAARRICNGITHGRRGCAAARGAAYGYCLHGTLSAVSSTVRRWRPARASAGSTRASSGLMGSNLIGFALRFNSPLIGRRALADEPAAARAEGTTSRFGTARVSARASAVLGETVPSSFRGAPGISLRCAVRSRPQAPSHAP